MSEEITIESLQAEVEAMRNKNRELLGELKMTKEKLHNLQESSERDRNDLTTMKTRAAWEAVERYSGVLPDAMKFLQEELAMTIGFDDEGNHIFLDKNGNPVPEITKLENGLEKETGAVLSPQNPDHVRLITDPIRERLPLLWPRAVGAGQTGDKNLKYGSISSNIKTTEKQQFGLR